MDIVGDKKLPFEEFFHDRMAPILDDDFTFVAKARADIISLEGSHGKRIDSIKLTNGTGRILDCNKLITDTVTDFIEEIIFKLLDLFLGTENLIFKGLQFRNNITFPIDQGLLADKAIRHLGNLPFGHFNIIAKDFVESDL